MQQSVVVSARKHVGNLYGKTFASKASDALVLNIANPAALALSPSQTLRAAPVFAQIEGFSARSLVGPDSAILELKDLARNKGPAAGSITCPGDARGAIVVGATDENGTRVIPESSRGRTKNKRNLDCVAPGGTASHGLLGCLANGKVGNVGFGTSFAAPHVSGLLALLLEQDPALSPDDLRQKLAALCRPLPDFDLAAQGRGLPHL